MGFCSYFYGVIIMRSLGFNNIIISNNVFLPSIIEDTTDFLVEHGFRRMFFLLNHDVTSEPLAFHLDDKKKLYERLNAYKPRGCHMQLETNIIMGNDSIYSEQISRLAIKKTKYLFVEFPIFNGRDWIDSTLNHLLYKQKKKPVFVSFEKNIATYDKEFVYHLINTRLATFMIDLNSFGNPNAIPFIKGLIDANAVIIPGMSGVIENYANLTGKLEYFRKQVGQPLFTKMLINSSKSSQIVFGL